MLRTLPPTAAPMSFGDLLRGIVATFSDSDKIQSEFCDQIRNYFKAREVFPVSSGKAAIYISLQALQNLSTRREVIIPAYASFCLASAVARSDVSVKLCNIDPETLDYDMDKLKASIVIVFFLQNAWQAPRLNGSKSPRSDVPSPQTFLPRAIHNKEC